MSEYPIEDPRIMIARDGGPDIDWTAAATAIVEATTERSMSLVHATPSPERRVEFAHETIDQLQRHAGELAVFYSEVPFIDGQVSHRFSALIIDREQPVALYRKKYMPSDREPYRYVAGMYVREAPRVDTHTPPAARTVRYTSNEDFRSHAGVTELDKDLDEHMFRQYASAARLAIGAESVAELFNELYAWSTPELRPALAGAAVQVGLLAHNAQAPLPKLTALRAELAHGLERAQAEAYHVVSHVEAWNRAVIHLRQIQVAMQTMQSEEITELGASPLQRLPGMDDAIGRYELPQTDPLFQTATTDIDEKLETLAKRARRLQAVITVTSAMRAL